MISDDASTANLAVFSSDGIQVGTLAGYVAEVRDDEAAMEQDMVDATDPQGRPLRERRLLVNGHGFPSQVVMAVPEDQFEIDLRGRRATLAMTAAQIAALPHIDSSAPELPPINATTPDGA
jgi:hypothetical protein